MNQKPIIALAAALVLAAGCGKKEEPALTLDQAISGAEESLRLGQPAEAHRLAQAALAADPESAEAALTDAVCAYLEKDYARAARHCTEIVKTAALPPELKARACAIRAVVHLVGDEIDAARIDLLRALRFDRRNAQAWYHLGYMSRETYGFEEAAYEQFQMFTRLSPAGDARTRDVQRKVLPMLAEAVRRKAAEAPGAARREPGLAAKLLTEGEAAKKKKDFKTARAKYEKAFQADPLSFPAAWECANLRAKDAKAAGGVDRTLEVYRAALDAKPTSLEAYLATARYALTHGRAMVATAVLNRALAHFPDSRKVVLLYADALAHAGQGKAAEQYRAFANEKVQ